jgi:hypothetical protein
MMNWEVCGRKQELSLNMELELTVSSVHNNGYKP